MNRIRKDITDRILKELESFELNKNEFYYKED
jgi:hypothetical protein